ncbi:MAG TPA: PRC-barrel domain-containing protein [Actinomycetota bacterium]|nr:PRC-barrel domain-containing protein [Actinomycetota bacterium]
MAQDRPDDKPIAWLALAEGTVVVSADGVEIGRVSEIVGDTAADIFSGITLRSGLFAEERFVPAERVARITPAAVHLDVGEAETADLQVYER